MKENLCGWLDVARGIAIILVVLGHSAQYYLYPGAFRQSLMWSVIYSFHMRVKVELYISEN